MAAIPIDLKSSLSVTWPVSGPRRGEASGVSLPLRREGRNAAGYSAAASNTFGDSHGRGRIAADQSEFAGADSRRVESRRVARVRQFVWPGGVWLRSQAGPAGCGCGGFD